MENFLPPGFAMGSEVHLGDDGGVDGEGFVHVNRQRRIGRNLLWRLWLSGASAGDRRVQPHLRADHNPGVWWLGSSDRLSLASGYGHARQPAMHDIMPQGYPGYLISNIPSPVNCLIQHMLAMITCTCTYVHVYTVTSICHDFHSRNCQLTCVRTRCAIASVLAIN